MNQEYEINQIRDIAQTLETLCSIGPVAADLLGKIQRCVHPTKKMQSTADRVNMRLQTSIDMIEHLNELRSVYTKQMQEICEHDFVTDDFEHSSGGDQYGPRTSTLTYCVHCEKTK